MESDGESCIYCFTRIHYLLHFSRILMHGFVLSKKYHKLRQWKEDNNGDTLVPTSKGSSEDVKKLAKWVQNQRVFYKYFMNGDTKHIKQHRVDALSQIGFVWNVFDHQWNMNFEVLREYYEQHKTFDVPKRENSKLANFVLTMRNAMKAK